MTQEIFLKDIELAKWWNGVVQDSRFDKVMVYARAAVVETNPEKAHLEGISKFVEVLNTLPTPGNAPIAFPSSGLIHGAEPFPPKPEPLPPPPKKTETSKPKKK